MKRRRNSMEELRNDLIKFYRQRLACLPIAPLEEHHDAPLHDVYVQPELNVADMPTLGGVVTKSKKVPIYQYKDLFEHEGERKKKIFITAGAGMGKTSYAKRMALTWCQAWQHEKAFENKFERYDVDTMKTFKMLFFVQLRDTNSDDVNKMIQESVTQSCRKTDGSTIEEALNTDTSLIILDGLDQWQTNKSKKQECSIPFVRNPKCTVLTTSRPGSIVNLRKKDIDMHVKLSKLTRRASQQLEINFIRHLKTGHQEFEIMKDIDEFDALISESKLEEVRYTPYILQQELCLWFEKREVRKSMFESYKNVVELAFNRAVQGKKTVEQNKEMNFESISVPAHIQDTEMCRLYYPSLLKLGDTALKMLCEQRFVMKEEEAKVYQDDVLAFFNSAGILTVTKNMAILTKIVRQFSFQERSIQEFFAALYMVGEWNSIKHRKEMVKKCIELPDMMELKNVLNFVKDIDDKLHVDMYNTLVLRSNLSTYIEESKPKIVRLYGGRFTQFEESDVEAIMKEVESDTTVIGQGSFGSVHKSCKLQETYGTLAVKKVHCKNNKDTEESIRQEYRASKLLHPFLLSVMTIYRTVAEENKTYYLILPYCENGDLYEALHGQKKLELDWLQRTRIILQVTYGIEYLHSGTSFREPMIHKDICTRNIVLDRKCNARLIDYSIARDQDDLTIMRSARSWYHPDGATRPGSTSDYFSLGVVIRELLTNEEADSKKNNEPLKHWTSKEVEQSRNEKIWPKNQVFEVASKFADLCLSADNDVSLLTEVIDELQTKFQELSGKLIFRIPDDEERCVLCLVNKGSLEATVNMHTANCTEQAFKICVSCEQKSLLNPIKCHACRAELKPSIGKDWWAILVAGNDKDKKVAEGFSKDVDDIKNLVISTAPLIMGIRESNVKVVKPNKPAVQDKQRLVDKFETVIEELKKEMEGHKNKTLLVYVSCHGNINGGFDLGLENDTLEKEKMQKLLNHLEVEKVIMFMDRCYPSEIELQKGTKRFQLNACKANEETSVTSPFTKHLIEVMTERKAKCLPGSRENIYTTATTLLERVSQRFEEQNIGSEPVFYSPAGSLQYKEMKIAYCNSQPLTVTVHCGEQTEEIEVDSLRSLDDFKTDIHSLFHMDQKTYSVKILRDTIKRRVATAQKNAKTGRVQETCSSMQDVIMARVQHEKLTAEFKKTT